MHTRNTIIMAVVFLLLAGFVYFYEIRGRDEREEAERQAELLVVFEPDEVASLTVESGEDRVVARRADDEWSIVEPRPLEADGQAFDTLIDNLSRATHERLVSESPEDLAPFGLADPEARVTVTLQDGSELTVAVGKDTPVGANLYVATDSGEVYSSSRVLRGQLSKSLLDLRDRTVLSFDRAAVRGLEIDREGYSASLTYDPSAGDDGAWSLQTPVESRADGDTLDDLLTVLADSEAEAYVADELPDEAALADHGLTEPWMRIGLRTGDDAWIRLLIGGESEEPEGRYAMREGSDSIFVVPPDLIAEVPASAAALRNRDVLAFARERVEAIELDRDGAGIRLERSLDGGGWNIVAPATLEADASAISGLLSTLQDLRAEAFADSAPDGAAALTMRLELGGDSEDEERVVVVGGGESREITPLDAADDAEPVRARAVSVEGDPTVYWVAADEVAELEVELFDLRDKTLAEFTEAELTELEITTADGRSWTLVRSDGEWSLPGGEIDSESVDDLLWELNFLRMEGVASETTAADLARWGLATPRVRLEARTAEGTAAAVSIGAEAPSEDDAVGRVYVLVDGRDGVYTVAAGLADVATDLVEDLGS